MNSFLKGKFKLNKIVKAILAQSVERTALNRVVEGSIPSDRDFFFFFFFSNLIPI